MGVIKRKIKKRNKEHLADIRLNRGTTALARYNNKNSIQQDSLSIKKLANYVNHNYAYMRETIEILNNKPVPVNDIISNHIDDRYIIKDSI